MTPEKRLPEEDLNEQEPKRLKEDIEDGEKTEDKDLIPLSDGEENKNDEDVAEPSSSESNGKKLFEESGTLLFAGSTEWSLIGKRHQKMIPAKQHFVPRRLKQFAGEKIAFVASHCSAAHTVIVNDEGKVWTVGRNEKGQLGCGDCEPRGEAYQIEALNDVKIVAAAVGRNHTIFLADDGTAYACGDNKSGQCGVGNNTATITTPTKIEFKEGRICKVACGAEFSMILNKRGYLYSFGCPEYGQLGHNTDGKYFVTSNKLSYQFETAPKRIPIFVECTKGGHPSPITDAQIVDVSCGNNHTVCVDAKKRAYAWGFGGYGRLGHAEPKDEMIPRLIKFFDGHNRGVLQVFCGGQFTIANTELGVYLWGQTKRTGEANMYPKPIQDLYGWNVRAVGCSATSVVIAADDTVIAWGPSPTYGELGLGENTKSTTTPKECKALDGVYVYSVACGLGHTFYVAREDNEKDKSLLAKLKEVAF